MNLIKVGIDKIKFKHKERYFNNPFNKDSNFIFYKVSLYISGYFEYGCCLNEVKYTVQEYFKNNIMLLDNFFLFYE